MEPTRDSAGLGGLWRPTEREQRAYAHLLSLNDADNEGLVRGQFAVPFFQKSGLPDAVLGGIWQLADTDSKGHLTAQEFSVAMKLISLAQAHRPVALSNLKDEVQLPDMKGVDLSQVAGPATGASIGAGDSHARRDSTASSAGWSNLMISSGSDASAEPTVPLKDRQQYKQIFEKSQPVDGAISAAAARALFTKTKLSSEQLGSIWALADPNSEGKLRLPGFIVAMYYIRSLMSNRSLELPRSCPSSLWRSAGGEAPLRSPTGSSLANMSTPDLASSPHWDVTPDERMRYDQFFRNLDQQRAGYLSGDVPVNFFLKSKLPEASLSKIWDLADISHNGRLDIEEFSVAMHLINAHLAGDAIPDRLPATLVPPSLRRASISSTSQINLSPPLRPSSARDRLQMIDTLKRSTTYTLPPRGPMSAGISRSSTGRSPAQLSPVLDESEVSSLQSQLSHLEDISRGLQTQRNTSASQLAMAGSRKHDLEMKISALQATHEAETRVNQELQERLKIEEARVGVLQEQTAEAGRALSIVSAQRSQLEQDVHRVQTQQLAAQQALRQAQEDSQRLSAEIAALEQQKRHLEQTLVVAQRQAQQQREVENRALSERAEVLRGDVAELTRQTAALPMNQGGARQQRESLSFDDIFGTNDTGALSPGDTAFGDMFKSPPNPTADEGGSAHGEVRPDTADTTESFARFAVASDAASSRAHSPLSVHQQLPPSSIFATMPVFGAAETSTGAAAFDSFGARADDPFEEFLQSTSTGTPTPKLTSRSPLAAAAAPVVAEAKVLLSARAAAATTDDLQPKHADGARASADLRSASSTPAPSGLARASTEGGNAKTNLVSPSADEIAVGGGAKRSASLAAVASSSEKQSQGFGADFGTAFGMLPSSSERAIKQDMEAFETNFPDISTLDIAAEVAQNSVTKLDTVPEAAGDDLTFDSVFGHGGGSQEATASKAEEDKPTAVVEPAPVSSSQNKDEDDGYVPPPVVKRTNVTARPMSRVLSIFRSSNNRNTLGGGIPALPKRSATGDKRDQDRKFEEAWSKGDWPEWVRKGEYVMERRMLLEMGYPKDRVVEALEVNDFNLAQATDYLLSC